MGNTVGSLRQDNKISSRERAIIIGTILGDAHLGKTKNGVRLEIGHSNHQKLYVFWKYRALRRFAGAAPHLIKINDDRYQRTYQQWRFKTRTHEPFARLHDIFYPKGKKIVPKFIDNLLNSPLSLAVWFMDDGGRRNDSYGLFLNTLSFSESDHERLRQCLKKNFSLETRLHWISDGYRLYIPSGEAVRFCGLVDRYLIPSMKYKLPYNPVTTSFARLDRARDRKIKKDLTLENSYKTSVSSN